MCGIAGKISWSQVPDVEKVRAMTNEMWKRGPDADGFFSNNFVAFGHRRLAIIDLSETGRQPMADHSGQYWITFNGEIYNFGEVRRELEQSGAQFRSKSDTEVILEAYKRWGDECLQRFNGMFAFALWDNVKQRCLLARDRLGKKPLFYATLGDGDLIFASELKALLRSGLIPWRLNTEALSQYLSLGYVLSNACILDGVKKLEPASAMASRTRPADPSMALLGPGSTIQPKDKNDRERCRRRTAPFARRFDTVANDQRCSVRSFLERRNRFFVHRCVDVPCLDARTGGNIFHRFF